MEDDFNKDEFDEFKNFDRNKLNKLFQDRMADEEFKKRFMNIIGGYQRDYDSLMKVLWGMKINPFEGLTSFDPNKDSFLKGLDFKALNEDGWNSEHWASPDGSTYVSSFTRSMGPEDFYYSNISDEELPNEKIIEMMEKRLVECIEDENYEEAADLRDTIERLKEEKEDESNK